MFAWSVLIAIAQVGVQQPKPAAKLGDFLQVLPSTAAKGASKGPQARKNSVEIDSMVKLAWDQQGLMEHLSSRASLAKGPTVDLSPEILALTKAGNLLQKVQGAELKYRIRTLAVMGSKGNPLENAGVQEAKDDLKELRSASADSLTGSKGPEARYLVDLAATLRGGEDEGFDAFRESALDLAKTVEGKLTNKMEGAPIVSLYLSAHLVTPYGRPIQVHVPNYDKLEAGTATPFARNRLVLDARTLEELQAAQQLFDAIKAYQDLDLPSRIEEAERAYTDGFTELIRKINVEFLTVKCKELLEQLKDLPEDRCGQVLKDVRSLQALFNPLKCSEILDASTQAGGLVLFANTLDQLTRSLWTFIREAPLYFQNLAKDVLALAASTPGVMKEETVDYFGGLWTNFRDEFSEIESGAKSFEKVSNKLSKALLLTADFSLVGKDLVGRKLDPEESLDTELDMKTIGGVRRPGDRLVVSMNLKQKAGEAEEVALESDAKSLFVEAYGGYLVTSGSLLFVDPRSPIDRDLSYEPAVGLSYNFHYGIKGNDFWNRTLNPGIGVTFSMLNFSDTSRFELGVGLGVSLFHNSVLIGMGRNINANSNYFYVGFSPYTLTGLFRRATRR